MFKIEMYKPLPDDCTKIVHGCMEGVGTHKGFVDQHGNFMDCKEAMAVAVASCQIKRSIGYDSDKLFSEHLH